ncbi:pyridoxal 5'-phosphate synthase [Nocardia sp. NPDC058058]|uniref:pyridoxine/pyridoxamine 5'-phosphate oxidase n=1 Tax=Nocardia sp. NPDC058058 TaxID=3346317 RepID=UPI0036DC00B7
MDQSAAVDGLREILRGLPVLKGTAPAFDPSDAPEDPVALFAEWFRLAVDTGVREPHAMTLSTVAPTGQPSARVLILKDVDCDGWHFAINAASRKGRELSECPVAALTFYWPELVRQVRVCGSVVADAPEVAAADFLARPDGSRRMALTRRQSQVLADSGDLDAALEQAGRELELTPDLVPAEWTSYAVRPLEIEFWQGDSQRRHQRLRYTASGGEWSRAVLWP